MEMTNWHHHGDSQTLDAKFIENEGQLRKTFFYYKQFYNFNLMTRNIDGYLINDLNDVKVK